jgi:hypothetical protein
MIFANLENADTMEERIGRIGRIRQIETDFFLIFLLETRALGFKKSVSIRPIRLIRSSIVSAFSKTLTNQPTN